MNWPVDEIPDRHFTPRRTPLAQDIQLPPHREGGEELDDLLFR